MSTTDTRAAGAGISKLGKAALDRFTWKAYVHKGDAIFEFSQPLERLICTPQEARELGIAMLKAAASLEPHSAQVLEALEALTQWTATEGQILGRRLLGPSGGPAG